eukprot:GSChrysophyteH1.ASY1.ANO1.2018.1 assembled CDS
MWSLVVVLTLLSLVGQSEGACANGCSGHGTCGQNNICSCFSGWDAGAADCSFRSCPTGPAWADKPYDTDKAHLPATCSNAGICDHKSGQCECFEGFTGSACQRSRCPNNCNGHGTCVSIADMSYYYGADYVQNENTAAIGDGVGIVYTNWDKDSITMCECDPSYFGADCSLHMCAKGDDPLTINQNYRQIKMILDTASTFGGDIGFTFQGVTVYIDLDATPTDSACKSALESSQHIGTVSCTYTATSSTKWEFAIEFHSWPTLSRSNNLFNHNGNPLISDFTCDGSLATGSPTCTFQDVQNTNIREWAYCSNRGTCDFNSGSCSCNNGYGGAACSNSTFFHGTGVNAAPGLQVLADGSDYLGDVLQVRSAKSASSDFYLIEAIANNQRMFFVRGDGAVGFTSLVTPGGATISSGGLMVADTGATITSGGLLISDGSETSVLTAKADSTSAPGSNFAVLDVRTDTTYTHTLVSAKDSNDAEVFGVKSSGEVAVHKGGITVTGGLSVGSGGLKVTGGLSLESHGLNVAKMGITVQEGPIVAESGVHIKAGGFQIDGGSFKIKSSGADIESGGLRVNSGLAQIKAGMRTTGGHTVMSGGLRVTGGITVQSLGMNIQDGGLAVVGGITVSDTGIVIDSQTFTTANDIGGSVYQLTTSDRRLKESIQAVKAPLDKLSKLKGIYYHWNKDIRGQDGFDHRRHLGYLAQDVMDAVPEAVQTLAHDDQYLGIDYPSLVPLITEGINEMQGTTRRILEEIRDLREKVSSLEHANERRTLHEEEPSSGGASPSRTEKLEELTRPRTCD